MSLVKGYISNNSCLCLLLLLLLLISRALLNHLLSSLVALHNRLLLCTPPLLFLLALSNCPGLLCQRLHLLLSYLLAIELQLHPKRLVEHVRCADKRIEQRKAGVHLDIALEVVSEFLECRLDVSYGDAFAAHIVGFVGGIAEGEEILGEAFGFAFLWVD